MSAPKIWHNPRCSKSRETLAVLKDAGFEPVVLNYLDHAPAEAELHKVLALLNIPASALIRKGESLYKTLGLANADSDTLIKAMATHPILIERPIVFANGQAALGRPPEAVKRIL
ncbi:MAG: arsenate reductase (glutaredoxin) [Paracoccaceae bacterium]